MPQGRKGGMIDERAAEKYGSMQTARQVVEEFLSRASALGQLSRRLDVGRRVRLTTFAFTVVVTA